MGPRRPLSLAGFNPPPAAAVPPGDRNITKLPGPIGNNNEKAPARP